MICPAILDYWQNPCSQACFDFTGVARKKCLVYNGLSPEYVSCPRCGRPYGTAIDTIYAVPAQFANILKKRSMQKHGRKAVVIKIHKADNSQPLVVKRGEIIEGQEKKLTGKDGCGVAPSTA